MDAGGSERDSPAVDEMGAAIAHQLNEPLAALLQFLGEIQQRDDARPDDLRSHSIKKMVNLALAEVHRACSIMQKLDRRAGLLNGHRVTVAGRRGDIEAWSDHDSVHLRNSIQSRLTPREWEALKLITGGSSNKEGGRVMGISTRTFEVHRAHLMQKLGARNAADLVRMSLSAAR